MAASDGGVLYWPHELEQNFALFDTAIGPCGIAWTERGICRRAASGSATTPRPATRIMRRVPGATKETPPSSRCSTPSTASSRLLRGEPRDLTDIVIDDADTPEFNARVYAVARTIPPGQTMTYGEIAERLGDKLLAREVGQALGRKSRCRSSCRAIACWRRKRQDRRLLGPRRRGDEAAFADDRRRPAGRADIVRAACRCPEPPAWLNAHDAIEPDGTGAVTSP